MAHARDSGARPPGGLEDWCRRGRKRPCRCDLRQWCCGRPCNHPGDHPPATLAAPRPQGRHQRAPRCHPRRQQNKNKEQEQVCHGQHASARMSNTRTDFYTWHAKPADGRGRTWRLNKGHTTGRGSTPVVVAEWRGTTSLGPIPAVLTKNICCPARHMRITLVVPCVKYRSWVRFAARCIRRSDAPSTPRAI